MQDNNEKDSMENLTENQKPPLQENGGVMMEGHIRIFDPETGEDIVNKRNAIHYENMSEALAQSVGNKTSGFVHEIAFGNGGTNVDPTGVITYLPANSTGQNASLYNQTYYKVIDDNSSNIYSDVVISCLLDYGEPSGQQAFDNTSNFNDTYTFDELGLKSWIGTVNTGKLLTHVIFHPVQKSLNRLIQIDYTIRIQTLTNLTSL